MLNLLKRQGLDFTDMDIQVIINPSGVWTNGGPVADTGLTGRKIVCDQYGGYVPVGGGSFSGKDPSKVDRCASYALRGLAIKKLSEFPVLDWIEIQVAYGIGLALPLSLSVKTNNPSYDHQVLDSINLQSLTPSSIIRDLNLLGDLDYEKLSEGCHFYGHDW
jgi:S-adenosylmethionine synthetase